ncbi:MAG: hypothetical protein HOP19_20080 [Acidobacteria bacterium]|nr:hypothetical protein [Acidobacteriota bacterium]
MRKLKILLAAGFIVVGLSRVSYAQLKPERLPAQAEKLSGFVPTGWQIEHQLEGDLNKDAVADAVLVLVETMPVNADKENLKDNLAERQRALLALLKTADGKWSRAGVATKLLLCTRCGGAFFGVNETPVQVEIRNGVIVAHQEYGSRNLTNQTWRLRYDATTKQFGLIGLDITDFDRNTGLSMQESSNFLVGIKTITKTQMNEKGDEKILSSTRKTIAKTLKPMEAINVEDYYSK